MRRSLAVLAALALLPGLAACAGSAATARLDLKDACVWSEAAAKETDLRDRLPTGTMTLNTFSEVPFQVVPASLARTHRLDEPDACSGRVG